MTRSRRYAFTLVELLVVIGIIALLISILLPALSKARESGQSIKCLSNLRQLGTAFQMYINEKKGWIPYPVTTLGEQLVWSNVLDPYLANLTFNTRTGVAANREYTPYKQCPVYDTFEGDLFNGAAQNTSKGATKSYKMNTHLRHNNPAAQAKLNEVRDTGATILFGDGISLDQVGPISGSFESAEFSFEVNDTSQASPAIRHLKGANMVFVDGHAEHMVTSTIKKNLQSTSNAVQVDSWESEFINAAGTPTAPSNKKASYQSQGLSRNPRMPYIWGIPGVLYRP